MDAQKQVGKVFHDLFGIAPEDCTDALSMENVQGWDSVNHLTLVYALEESCSVQFSPEEISELTSVGRIKELLAHRSSH